MTSGLCHKIDEKCTVVIYYAASGGNLLPISLSLNL
jgi:hypothetical protein